MRTLEGKQYYPEVIFNDQPLDDYYTKDKTFGHFIEDGAAYVIEDRNTPRPWLQFLCNDSVYSVVSNIGTGMLTHCRGYRLTKYYENNYLIRNVNGKRILNINIDGEKGVEFFTQAENFKVVVRPGYVTYTGNIGDVEVETVVFVPLNAPCESWIVKYSNKGSKSIELKASFAMEFNKSDDVDFEFCDNRFNVFHKQIKALFTSDVIEKISFSDYDEKVDEDKINSYSIVELCNTMMFNSNESKSFNVVYGMYDNVQQENQILKIVNTADCELKNVKEKWDYITQHKCSLPNKNLEYFLNYWLKNQIYMTYRYDRGAPLVGYRDGFQDSWGYCLVDSQKAKDKIITTLSYMFADGKCPRQYSPYNENHDFRDFSDSPIWAADAIDSYIRETGDFQILNLEIGFLNSDEKSTVENHIYRSLDYLYNDRAQNGLIKICGGDWADGLSGINKFGQDASSVWITIAAYHAQNVMKRLYDEIGNNEKSAKMQKRCAEYKEIVNSVGWDGNWLAYGFFEDGEPIGSSSNLEGKIWLNPQTWGIFTGIIDDKDKIKKIDKSISRYLLTPFGSLVMYPPYVFYGERNGRVQRQRQGTFLNSAVYNHAASFKVFSDVARGDYDDALDTMLRALPNHSDNSDTCRTSEPYVVGNVYYGPNNHRWGMNLFSWFTATPSWLIHGGYEQILGVKSSYNGVEVSPHVPDEWNEYSVVKYYRGTVYNIKFIRDEDKGIWVDGEKQTNNIVKSNSKNCDVVVKF